MDKTLHEEALFVKQIFSTFFLIFLLTSCSNQEKRPMSVSANLWIGYSPLYYAQKKGWLRENNIKLIRTVSLQESLELFQNSFADILCGTQYEVQQSIQQKEKAGTIIPLDRSNGGDIILSNRSIQELKNEKLIKTYLEINSVNSVLLDYFKKKYDLKTSQLQLINSSQIVISQLPLQDEATLIITYNPNDIPLRKRAYKEIASTKDSDLFIIDVLYAPYTTQKYFANELQALNTIVYRALQELKNNPKNYFKTINSYFYYENYEEFLRALNSLEWIYSERKLLKLKRDNSPLSNKPEIYKEIKSED